MSASSSTVQTCTFEAAIVGVAEETRRDDAMALRRFRHLEAPIPDMPGRPPDPASVDSHPNLCVAGAGGHLGQCRPGRVEAAAPVPGRADPFSRACPPHLARQRLAPSRPY